MKNKILIISLIYTSFSICAARENIDYEEQLIKAAKENNYEHIKSTLKKDINSDKVLDILFKSINFKNITDYSNLPKLLEINPITGMEKIVENVKIIWKSIINEKIIFHGDTLEKLNILSILLEHGLNIKDHDGLHKDIAVVLNNYHSVMHYGQMRIPAFAPYNLKREDYGSIVVSQYYSKIDPWNIIMGKTPYIEFYLNTFKPDFNIINKLDNSEKNSLMWAAARGHFDIVKILLNYGQQNNKFVISALILAQKHNNFDIAKMLFVYLTKARESIAKLFRLTRIPKSIALHISKFIYGEDIYKDNHADVDESANKKQRKE